MIKMVVNTEPIDIKARFPTFLVPNFNKMDVVTKIIKMTKAYRPKTKSGILSLKTS
jgi:hypothetical protein